MVEDHELDAWVVAQREEFSGFVGHLESRLRLVHVLQSGRAEQHHHFGFYKLDLSLKIGNALRGLFSARVSVLRRPALHPVGNEHVAIRVETDGAHDFVEELTGTPHEGEALFVFVLARPFTDHHDVGGRIPAIDDDVRTPGVQRTLVAAAVTESLFELRVARRSEDRIAARVEEIELHGGGVYQEPMISFAIICWQVV